jgi:eukaryotic-like serine/threonine-protein kinase
MARIGQYQIGELLGEGGLGRVHAAYDVVLSREVAIKSLRPEFLNDAAFVARFRSEATNLARLNHPNITTVHALLEQGRSLYIVMERVRGQTLETLLKQNQSGLGLSRSLAIFAQAADGLAYAHSMGVIHRDIKPANIMIVPSSGLVKIMDFGIARLRGSQHQTREGSIIGTLAYMAPEQLRGEPASERSDLYSLAIVLYEMLTGSPPFVAATEYELMQAQINTKPRRLSSVKPDADARVDSALQRALAKKPEQRFASVPEFQDFLGLSGGRLGLGSSATGDLVGSSSGGHVLSALTAGVKRLRSTAAGLLPGVQGMTTGRKVFGIPAAKALPVLAGATALIVGLAVWGTLTYLLPGSPQLPGPGQVSVSKNPTPSGDKPAADRRSASALPPDAGHTDPSVVLEPPVLYPGRTRSLDSPDR